MFVLNYKENAVTLKLRAIKEERESRLKSRQMKGRGAIDRFLMRVADIDDANLRKGLMEGVEYAKGVGQQRTDEVPDSWMAHPLRVTEMVLNIEPRQDLNTHIISLLHNMMERFGLGEEKLADDYNETVARSIRLLTVDRAEERDPAWQANYYRVLENGFAGARIVKALDKLDNLFLLCLNPDVLVRERYLNEIHEYVMPMVRRESPILADYYLDVVNEAREFGFLDEAKSMALYGTVYRR